MSTSVKWLSCCVCTLIAGVHVPSHKCGGQRMTLQTPISPSTFPWAPGIELGQQACQASTSVPLSHLVVLFLFLFHSVVGADLQAPCIPFSYIPVPWNFLKLSPLSNNDVLRTRLFLPDLKGERLTSRPPQKTDWKTVTTKAKEARSLITGWSAVGTEQRRKKDGREREQRRSWSLGVYSRL